MIKTPTEIKSYCIVCNEVARDRKLSARAKGIYYYLATLPSNWQLTKKECMQHFTEGNAAFNTAFKELEKAGYIVGTRQRNDQNRFIGWSYSVHWHSISDLSGNRH